MFQPNKRGEVLGDWVTLLTTMAVGPYFVYVISAVSPIIIDEFELSNFSFGLLATTTFFTGGLFALLLASKFGTVKLKLSFILILSIAIAAMVLGASSSSAGLLFLAAIFSGLAQSGSNPMTNRHISTLDTSRKGLMVGWKQSGVQLSQLTAGGLTPIIATVVGWRWGFLPGIIIGLLGLLFCLQLRMPKHAVTTAAHKRVRKLDSQLRLLVVHTFLISLTVTATSTYIALYSFEVLDFSPVTSGLTMTLVALAGIFSRVVLAQVSSDARWLRKLLTLLSITASAGLVLIFLASVIHPVLLWIGIFLFGSSALATASVTMSTVVSSVSFTHVGSVSAKLNSALYFGFASGPLFFGFITNLTSFSAGWLYMAAIAAMTTLIALSLKNKNNSPT